MGYVSSRLVILEMRETKTIYRGSLFLDSILSRRSCKRMGKSKCYFEFLGT